MCTGISSRPECAVAAQKWDMERLCTDLAAVKKHSKPRSKSLSVFEHDYLCLLLSGHKPVDIAQMINWSMNAMKVELSNGLYHYICELTGKEIEDWRDIIITLEEKGYKKKRSQRMVVVIIDEADSLEAAAILERLRQITGDRTLNIMNTETGSLILYLQGAETTYEHLETLFQAGQLSQLLGYSVRSVQITEAPSSEPLAPLVHLRQWLQHCFESGWHPIEDLMAWNVLDPALAMRQPAVVAERAPTPLTDHDGLATWVRQLHPSLPEDLQAEAIEHLGQLTCGHAGAIEALAQFISVSQHDELRWAAADCLLRLQPTHPQAGVHRIKALAQQTLALSVAVLNRADSTVGVRIQLHPLYHQHLPKALKLTVLDASGAPFLDVRSRHNDWYLQLKFWGNLEERFTVQVSRETVLFAEDFVI